MNTSNTSIRSRWARTLALAAGGCLAMQASAQTRQVVEEPAEPSVFASPAVPIAHSAQPGKFNSPPDDVKKMVRQRPGGGDTGLDVRSVSTMNNAGEAGLDAPFPNSGPSILAPVPNRLRSLLSEDVLVGGNDVSLPAGSGGSTVPAPGAGLLVGLGLAAAARRRR